MKKDSATRRVYLSVMAEFRADGILLPKRFRWTDGNTYKIDRVIDIRPAGSLRSAPDGDRYTVFIQGQTRYMYFEHSGDISGNRLGRWYMDIPA